jgi:hypothetical protein
MSRLAFAIALLSICLTSSVVYAQNRPTRIVIYPLLVQTPIFGASIDLPEIPGGGGGGGGTGESGAASGSTDVALNTAYLFGVLVETNRFFGELTGTWADISADRQIPRVSLQTETLLFTGRGGVRFFKGFSATGGVHHMSMDLDAALELPNLGRTIEGRAKPAYWDPMVGLDWRGQYGRWYLGGYFEGGGFGVGTDVDLLGEVRADYRLGFFDLRFGYGIVHIEATVADVSIGSFRRKLVVNQTLHGPNIGFGIAF